MESLKNLNLPSSIKQGDIKAISDLIGKKTKGFSMQDKNALLAQLSSHQTLEENKVVIKDKNNMTNDEKKAYREELLKKLHKKTNMCKQERTPKQILMTNLESTIQKTNGKLSELGNLQTSNNALSNLEIKESEETLILNKKPEDVVTKVEDKEDKLEDFIN